MLNKLFLFLSLSVLLLSGCAASNVANTPGHSLRLLNADLASALNTFEATALQANQAGLITTSEAVSISQIINNATIASDGIEKCADNTAGTISGCIAPFVQNIQSKMNITALGIKSPNATATFNVSITAVLNALQKIQTAEAGQ
jgi:hypothetical protein